MRTSIVIAAYNEEKNIANVITSLRNEGYNDIIVVDDGSSDKTFEVSESLGATTLQHIVNLGQGAALQTGMSYAFLTDSDYIVHFDADGQHDPKEIKDMLKPLINNEAQVSLGSRFLKKTSNLPFIRKLYLKIGILVIWAFYGVKMTDAHNGFRAFTKEAAKKIIITTNKMEHASEIIEKIKKKKLIYKEIPVTIRYTEETLKEGRKGQGKFDSINIVFKMIMKKFGV